jgi:hypothetical protein
MHALPCSTECHPMAELAYISPPQHHGSRCRCRDCSKRTLRVTMILRLLTPLSETWRSLPCDDRFAAAAIALLPSLGPPSCPPRLPRAWHLTSIANNKHGCFITGRTTRFAACGARGRCLMRPSLRNRSPNEVHLGT